MLELQLASELVEGVMCRRKFGQRVCGLGEMDDDEMILRGCGGGQGSRRAR